MDTPAFESDFTEKAWILTFYAFKGGTGRTLAVTNIARYLAEEGGYRVGLVDLDLDSPGLPHQALCSVLDDHAAGGRRKLQEAINETPGFIDLYGSLHRKYAAPYFEEKSRAWDCDDIQIKPEELAASVFPLPSDDQNGSILLMPAGRGSVRRNHQFRESLFRFTNLISMPESEQRGVNPVRELAPILTNAIFRQFIREYSLDFVFLDGRTGTGAFFPVYGLAIPHALVLFVGLNDQNICGSLEILDAECEEGGEPSPVFLVASPIPSAAVQHTESRIEMLENKLREKRTTRRGEGSSRYVYECPDRVEFVFPYVDLATVQETYFIRKYPRSQLTQEYMRLADSVESLVATPMANRVSAHVAPGQLFLEGLHDLHAQVGEAHRVLRIALEEVHQAAIDDFLLGHAHLKEGRKESEGNHRSSSYQLDHREVVRAEYWSATDRDSPWERLSRGEVDDQDDLPDVVAIPQSLLRGVVATMRQHATELVSLSSARFCVTGNNSLSALDYRFLDRTYPGWRRWCIHEGRHYALPFSANTTVLCANEDLLRELCRRYWQKHCRVGFCEDRFLPSNWALLRELILARSPEDSFEAFGFATEGRGLYYEWLNLMLSLGQVDLEIGEGDVVADCRIQDAARITRQFWDLWSLVDSRSSNLSMSDLIHRFARNMLAMYVAWTDSFRFHWEGCKPMRVSPVALPGRSSPSEGIKIRLGPVPRQVTCLRRPLLANWVVVLPKVRNELRDQVAIRLMNLFLQPDVQRGLLKNGFPSSSIPVIDEELRSEPIQERHSPAPAGSNYRVFLRSLKEAIGRGHLVMPIEDSRDTIDRITDAVRDGARDEDAAVQLEAAFHTLHEFLVRKLHH